MTDYNDKEKKGKKAISPPKPEAFKGKQLDLFRSFICNGEQERGKLSNAFFLWDSVPRYAVSRQQMNKIRKEKGFLGLQVVEFQYQQTTFTATIQAARIIEKKTGKEIDYYPSANEELIEDALRKIAAEQFNGFLDQPTAQSGVVFTLHMLREEMKRRGHARSFQEIYSSLMILSGSMIEIKAKDGKGLEGLKRTNYFPDLTTVTKNKLADDPNAKWVVQFHPLVTKALNTLTYRQYNYAKMMSLKSQLARWIHKQLSLKHRSASLVNQFTMRFSTIKRDSALLEGYKVQQQAIVAVSTAFKELETSGVLMKVEKKTTLGHRGKIEDIAYTLTASLDFIAEMKAANKRENAIEKKI
jgi:hypothetical protein